MKEILSFTIGKIVDILPKFLARKVFPPEKVAVDIDIRLQGEQPIQVSMDRQVPRIDIFFELVNRSHIDLTLDRMVIDLWFGQPTLKGSVLERVDLPSREFRQNIHFRSTLTSGQVAQIHDFIENPGKRGYISLNLHSYFVGKVGWVLVKERIERHSI